MDRIKAEIERKRKANQSSLDGAPPTKYMRKGDLMRLEEEAKQKAALEGKSPGGSGSGGGGDGKGNLKGKGKESPTNRSLSPESASKAGNHNTPTNESSSSKPEVFNISNEEAVRRLRIKGQPIRLFAETDKERRLRLRALELIEEKDDAVDGGRNDFMKAMESMGKGAELEALARKGGSGTITNTTGASGAGGKGGHAQGGQASAANGANSMEGVSGDAKAGGSADEEKGKENLPDIKTGERLVDLAMTKKNPHKLYPMIYFTLKKYLREWEESMAERPDSVKQSTQGKKAAATMKQSADYLKPLLNSLRNRDLAPDVLSSVAEIVHHMQLRQYIQSNDAYLRLSIGNAPWPIGVTMVGIHERSAREKIFSNQVAHVLNDEVSRKYIQSLKRLLTFAQTKYPPEDLSQRMG